MAHRSSADSPITASGMPPRYGTHPGATYTVSLTDPRVAYAEVHDDETALTATAVLARAVDWFAARGVKVERVLSDDGSAYRSNLRHRLCSQLGITPK